MRKIFSIIVLVSIFAGTGNCWAEDSWVLWAKIERYEYGRKGEGLSTLQRERSYKTLEECHERMTELWQVTMQMWELMGMHDSASKYTIHEDTVKPSKFTGSFLFEDRQMATEMTYSCLPESFNSREKK